MTSDSNIKKDITIKEIKNELESLKKRDSEIIDEIKECLNQRDTIISKLNLLSTYNIDLSSSFDESQSMTSKVSSARILASSISSKVRDLDIAQSRVSSILHYVEDILDISNSIDTINSAIRNGSYEYAARNIHRILHNDNLAIPKENESYLSLLSLREKLYSLIINKANEEYSNKKYDEVIALCSLLPLLDKSEYGLRLHITVLHNILLNRMASESLTISSIPSKAIISYPSILSSIIRKLILFIKENANLNIIYPYGTISLIRDIQEVSDEMIIPWLTRYFEEKRMIILIKKIKKKERIRLEDIISIKNGNNEENIEELSPLKLDTLLQEIAYINRELERFDRETRRMAIDSKKDATNANKDAPSKKDATNASKDATTSKDATNANKDATASKDIYNTIHRITKLNEMCQQFNDYQLSIEEYYLVESIYKAIRIDTIDDSHDCKYTTMIDDCFFLISKSIERTFFTFNINTSSSIINYVNSILNTCIKAILDANMSNEFLNNITSSNTTMVFVILNNIELAYNDCLSLKDRIDKLYVSYFGEYDNSEILLHCIDDIKDTSIIFHSLLNHYVNQMGSIYYNLFLSSLKSFDNFDYTFDEKTFTSFEGIDPFFHNFILSISKTINYIKLRLTVTNFDNVISSLLKYILKQLESSIMSKRFSLYGGLLLDCGIRSLITFFSNLTVTSPRKLFTRLIQIISVLQLEKPIDVVDYWKQGRDVWLINEIEIKSILALRVEFTSKSIKSLKFYT